MTNYQKSKVLKLFPYYEKQGIVKPSIIKLERNKHENRVVFAIEEFERQSNMVLVKSWECVSSLNTVYVYGLFKNDKDSTIATLGFKSKYTGNMIFIL
jgi:hypothetical protein